MNEYLNNEITIKRLLNCVIDFNEKRYNRFNGKGSKIPLNYRK